MKRKVLVLEDEESIRSFLVLNMKRGGYEVIEAETGEQALEKYHENPDIAVAILAGHRRLRGLPHDACRGLSGRRDHADRAHAGGGQGKRSDERRG